MWFRNVLLSIVNIQIHTELFIRFLCKDVLISIYYVLNAYPVAEIVCED